MKKLIILALVLMFITFAFLSLTIVFTNEESVETKINTSIVANVKYKAYDNGVMYYYALDTKSNSEIFIDSLTFVQPISNKPIKGWILETPIYSTEQKLGTYVFFGLMSLLMFFSILYILFDGKFRI